MKLTLEQIKKIIKEELKHSIGENRHREVNMPEDTLQDSKKGDKQ